MKTEVYSWRLSSEVKSDLEREARQRKLPVSSVLDLAVREWLKKNDVDAGDQEAQRRLPSAASGRNQNFDDIRSDINSIVFKLSQTALEKIFSRREEVRDW
jgi:hypothetical protein